MRGAALVPLFAILFAWPGVNAEVVLENGEIGPGAIPGAPDPIGSGGCGCSFRGESGAPPLALLLVALLLVVGRRLHRS